MKAADLRNALIRSTVERDGKLILTCVKALHLAEKSGISPKRIGRMCNDAGIKIRKCKLGCF